MKKLNVIVEEFCDLGTRVAFDLQNGEHYEGYICEIETDYLMFRSGGPLAPDEDIEIRLLDIDLNTLAYFDEQRRCYMDANWDNSRDCWLIKHSNQEGEWLVYPNRLDRLLQTPVDKTT
jgi:hypothetical protein